MENKSDKKRNYELNELAETMEARTFLSKKDNKEGLRAFIEVVAEQLHNSEKAGDNNEIR